MKKQWIRHLSHCLQESMEIPLFGQSPSFDMELFQHHLSTKLNLPQLTIERGNAAWKEASDILNDLGENPSVMSVGFSPITGTVHWVMSQEDLIELSTWTLSLEQQNYQFIDPELQKGFYHYTILQALHALYTAHIFSDLSPKIEKTSLTQEKSFSIDISLRNGEKTVWGRLLIPRSFQQAFQSHYGLKKISLRDLKTHSTMMLSTHLTLGRVSLIPSELDAIEPGDFVLLDHSSYYPHTKKGYFLLSLNSHALFQVKRKEDHLKVLDYAYEIEGNYMAQDEDMPQDSTPIEELLEEGQLDREEMEKEEGNFSEESFSLAEDQAMVSPHEVPLQLSIEVAKLNVSLNTLLNLQPGNVINTSVRPEQGVKLSLNGRIIGKGELLQIGDAIGVKIIEIANQ